MTLQSSATKVPQVPYPISPQATLATADPRTHAIGQADLLDKIGLGAWADIAVMSVFAAFLGMVIVGLILWAFGKAFGTKDSAIIAYNNAEKMVFDLETRKATGQARISGITSQIKAVNLLLQREKVEDGN